MAQHLQDESKSYRIITPYDAQRNASESDMKDTEGLEWNDKCFNVDSFQGFIFSSYFLFLNMF